ncbi:apolipoprotein N-acyltransferase [Rariglobus hedericola]|uniref:Apolipoprotein N-acyltransferase n=1 Tax=Rariglobus hedericola TaxID=2597822 RepID=A0A556QL24_9BACT|nr:apolipoprotein N-acyltransferase [Rariglobus hedericola]TSJ77349.1 apolipoprotein N-acyltransferase [Rariglobus hedericola]
MADDFPLSDINDASYDQPPAWWQRHANLLWSAGVFIATVVLTVLAFPPSRTPEFAYAFAVPALFWAYLRPSFRLYAWTVLGAQAVAWTILFGWLHNVTIGGLVLLGPFIGAWIGSWFLAARWALPRMIGQSTSTRLLVMFGLAGLWVVGEWTRTWVLSGFPWMPLAATQWQRMTILQIAAFTGAGGVSFVLIAMNLGFTAYAHRLIREGRHGLGKRSQEFFAAMFLLVICVATQLQETFNRRQFTVPLGRIAFVQPYIAQDIKWDNTKGPAILEVLETLTLAASATKPDLILWPEATTPWAVKGDPEMRAWVETLVNRAGAPLVLGSIARQPSASDPTQEDWLNAVFVVDPVNGLQPHFYAKRKLVPFGEYVPLRPLLGWLGKFVPIGGDFLRGTDPAPLQVSVHDRPLAVGALLCYEDIFPHLSRESVQAGADLLVVNTNNGWFGEGGAAYQHASNAVLRAVETRRPLLRCGNGGWSGWVDEFGSIRAVLTRDRVTGEISTENTKTTETGTVYFRGTQTVSVTADARWIGKQSFYVRHGDWFILACALLAAGGFALIRTVPPAKPSSS